MGKDISGIIKKAISTDLIWSVSIFYEYIEIIKKIENIGVIFWDDEDNWATIVHCGDTIGYIWKKYPLFFFETTTIDFSLIQNSYNDEICFIKVNSLNEDLFSIQNIKMKNYLINSLSFESFNFNLFSVNDFWFITAT